MRPSDDAITARLSRTIEGWFPEEYARDFSTEERRTLAKSGAAMPDGSFPIVTTEDLKNAIQLARTPAQRAHIKKRAAALGASKAIPETWAFLGGEVTDTAATVAPHDQAVTAAIKNVVALQEKAPDGKTDPNDAKVLAALHEARDAQQKDNQGHGLAY